MINYVTFRCETNSIFTLITKDKKTKIVFSLPNSLHCKVINQIHMLSVKFDCRFTKLILFTIKK